MSLEVEFFKRARENRVPISETRIEGFVERAILYINSSCYWAQTFGIEGFPFKEIKNWDEIDLGDARRMIMQLELFMEKIRAKNIFEMDQNLANKYVYADENWKARANTLISHLREAVRNADIPELLRESINAKIESLSKEIERNRPSAEAIAETWLLLTDAAGQGIKNLNPARKLIENIGRWFVKLREENQKAQENPALSPPDEILGVENNDEGGSDA